jgi:hypothetical protein
MEAHPRPNTVEQETGDLLTGDEEARHPEEDMPATAIFALGRHDQN